MTVFAVEGNRIRLDGGSMFGNCPKALWEKWFVPDASNRIELACRSLLLVQGEKKTLFDVGVGDFFPPKMKERFGIPASGHLLIENLEELGISEEEITGVVLTHLHFDHAGGLLAPYGEEEGLRFPNATIYVGREHWLHAQNPPAREKASFLPQLHTLLEKSGRLEFIEGQIEGVHFSAVHGHTRGMLIAFIEDVEPIVVAADVIPGSVWLNPALAMGYDRFPELTCQEKETLLQVTKEKNARLFFTHDPTLPFKVLSRESV